MPWQLQRLCEAPALIYPSSGLLHLYSSKTKWLESGRCGTLPIASTGDPVPGKPMCGHRIGETRTCGGAEDGGCRLTLGTGARLGTSGNDFRASRGAGSPVCPQSPEPTPRGLRSPRNSRITIEDPAWLFLPR
ncbi:hypothetical protein NDU88_003816 [Pleurodeles waltl]|uniref:Uncharacterized protein n=1 Tax=Pleurodeles waltl TaxID=8319 RepID=A0AAV7T6J0_PLEWA|nr:hypothetical protein NDU88_003816 [Pleurodeles waltl]